MYINLFIKIIQGNFSFFRGEVKKKEGKPIKFFLGPKNLHIISKNRFSGISDNNRNGLMFVTSCKLIDIRPTNNKQGS